MKSPIDRLDDLFQELRNTRTELSVKITDAMHELTVMLQACEQQVAHNNQLAAIEHTQTALQAELVTLKALLPAPRATPSAPQQASTAPSLAMNAVMRELSLRESKKANIVISGIKPSLLSDADLVTNLLRDELNIDATIIKCSRLGKATPAKPSPSLLLATLSSEQDTRAALFAAKQLCSSTDQHICNNVYLSADLTREQRVHDYNLRSELQRRRAAGEQNLIIRSGHIIVRPVLQNQQGAQPAANAP